jgi:hypothetical protein
MVPLITKRILRLLFALAVFFIVCGFFISLSRISWGAYGTHRKAWLNNLKRIVSSVNKDSFLESQPFRSVSLLDFLTSCNASVMNQACSDMQFKRNMKYTSADRQPCLWGSRSYKTGLGHQMTEIIMYARMSRIYALPHIFEKFSDAVSIHSSSYEWANEYFGLEKTFDVLGSSISAGRSKQVEKQASILGCREFVSVDSAHCDDLTEKHSNSDASANDCFKSPLMHMLFANFSPCLRESSLCHGDWVAQARAVEYDPSVVNIAWHIRVGDATLYEASSSYYREILIASDASHVAWHTSAEIKTHKSHVTRHTSHITRHTSHVTRHTSHVTRHTSHVTRHTSLQ